MGRRVMEAQETGRIETAWKAKDCRLPEEKEGKTTRVYTGCDGVMVPVITESEKVKRRDSDQGQASSLRQEMQAAAAAEAWRRSGLEGVQSRLLL